MTIENKLNYLKTTKDLIKNAIIGKGVDITPNTPFRDYASKIGEIPTSISVKTQQEYDDLEVKDPNTLYLIVEE